MQILCGQSCNRASFRCLTKLSCHPCLIHFFSCLEMFYNFLSWMGTCFKNIRYTAQQLMLTDDKRYLAAYSFNYLLVSMIIMSVGSMIPFLAARRGLPQTEFFFLFIARSIGCLMGGLLVRVLKHLGVYPPYHHVFRGFILVQILFTYLFVHSQGKLWQGVTMAIVTMVNYGQNMNINICLTLVASRQNLSDWLSVAYGAFGMGGILGPLLVRFAEHMTYLYIGLAFTVFLVVYSLLPSPTDAPPVNATQNQGQQNEQQIAIQQQEKYGSCWLDKILSCMVFLLFGLEFTINGWLVTYAVETGVAQKHEASIFPAIFWALTTFFRLLLTRLGLKQSTKLIFFSGAQLVSGVFCMVLGFAGAYNTASYSCAILFGATLSPILPCLLSIAGEYGLKFRPEQTANIIMGLCFADCVFCSAVGVLMGKNIDVFFSGLTLIGVIFCLALIGVFHQLRKESEQKVSDIEEE